MIAGIILAAGESKRFNRQNKLTLPLGSGLIIERVLETALKSVLARVILVVKPDDNEIIEIGKKYNTTIIFNPEYKNGMSSSIKAALLELDKEKSIEGFCVLLGDQPFISSKTIDSVVKAFQKGKKEIVVPCYRGKCGNPVLFDIAWQEDFMKISGDVGGRVLIRLYPDKIKKVEISDNTILFDIDSEEDYRKAISHLIALKKLRRKK